MKNCSNICENDNDMHSLYMIIILKLHVYVLKFALVVVDLYTYIEE